MTDYDDSAAAAAAAARSGKGNTVKGICGRDSSVQDIGWIQVNGCSVVGQIDRYGWGTRIELTDSGSQVRCAGKEFAAGRTWIDGEG